MAKFTIFALYLCIGVTFLIIFPLMMHPTLSGQRKLWWSIAAFLILVPGGLALYAWVGVPQMAR